MRYVDVIELACSVRIGKLFLWLYFEFPEGTAHPILSVITRALLSDEKNCFITVRHFRRISAKMFGRKRFLLNVKMFSFEYLFKNTNQ